MSSHKNLLSFSVTCRLLDSGDHFQERAGHLSADVERGTTTLPSVWSGGTAGVEFALLLGHVALDRLTCLRNSVGLIKVQCLLTCQPNRSSQKFEIDCQTKTGRGRIMSTRKLVARKFDKNKSSSYRFRAIRLRALLKSKKKKRDKAQPLVNQEAKLL